MDDRVIEVRANGMSPWGHTMRAEKNVVKIRYYVRKIQT